MAYAKDYWQRIIRQAVEEFWRVYNQTEDFVHDQMIPAILETAPPDERDAMYNALNLDDVKQQNPKIWARLAPDALNIQQRNQNQLGQYVMALQKQMQDDGSGAQALKQLDKQESGQDQSFKYETRNRPIFGLRTAMDRVNTLSTGLDASPGVSDLPMG